MNGKKTAPVEAVDFQKFLHGTRAEQALVVKQIDKAFQDIGFVFLFNHGIPQSKVDECFAWTKSKMYFNQSKEDKSKALHPPGTAQHRGYAPIGLEKSSNLPAKDDTVRQQQSPDAKESYDIGHPEDSSQPNIWPPEGSVPGFQGFMESFHGDCEALSRSLLQCLAQGLKLNDPDLLMKPHEGTYYHLRLTHYPEIATEDLNSGNYSRLCAHSDFDTFTLLFQDAVGGFEVEDPSSGQDGKFLPVEPRPASVLVNVGDFLERWSNGRWRSGRHRVGAPPQPAVGGSSVSHQNGETGQVAMTTARFSVPFYAMCDVNTVIDALPGCHGPANPKKWEPIAAGEYISKKLQALW